MNQKSRLESAKHWILKYSGNNLLRGYRIHYGVSRLCAAIELQKLGVEITQAQIEAIKLEEKKLGESRVKKKEMKKQKEAEILREIFINYDDEPYLGTW